MVSNACTEARNPPSSNHHLHSGPLVSANCIFPFSLCMWILLPVVYSVQQWLIQLWFVQQVHYWGSRSSAGVTFPKSPLNWVESRQGAIDYELHIYQGRKYSLQIWSSPIIKAAPGKMYMSEYTQIMKWGCKREDHHTSILWLLLQILQPEDVDHSEVWLWAECVLILL